jgi:hypothetical protein
MPKAMDPSYEISGWVESTTTTDQDLSLQEEGDGLLNGRETDLMLVSQVAPRRQQPAPPFLPNLRLDPVGQVLKDGFFLEFWRRHRVL